MQNLQLFSGEARFARQYTLETEPLDKHAPRVVSGRPPLYGLQQLSVRFSSGKRPFDYVKDRGRREWPVFGPAEPLSVAPTPNGPLSANYGQNSDESLSLRDRFKSVNSPRLNAISS